MDMSASGWRKHPLSPYEPIELNKRVVATSQLETAIRLWFEYGDPVSIHTLAAAAHGIFHVLGKQIGEPSIILDYLRSLKKPDYDRFAEAQNFFKHSNTDVNDLIGYDPMHAEIIMLDCIHVYGLLAHDVTLLMAAFVMRFSLAHPQYLDLREVWDPPVPKGLEMETMTKVDRPQFLSKFLTGK